MLASKTLCRRTFCTVFANAQKSRDSYEKYMDDMEQNLFDKLGLIYPHIRGTMIADIGCSRGKLLKSIYEKDVCNNIKRFYQGVDLSYKALQNVKLERTVFSTCNAFDVNKWHVRGSKLDTVILCSTLHELYSYANVDRVEEFFKNVRKILNHRGRIIIRDFIKPHSNNELVHFIDHEDPERFKRFAGDFCKKVDYNGHGKSFSTTLESFYEYIYHKDYADSWEAEMKESYGYSTFNDLNKLLCKVGYSLKYAEIKHNKWIIENRLKNKIEIINGPRQPDFYPEHGCILVYEKE